MGARKMELKRDEDDEREGDEIAATGATNRPSTTSMVAEARRHRHEAAAEHRTGQVLHHDPTPNAATNTVKNAARCRRIGRRPTGPGEPERHRGHHRYQRGHRPGHVQHRIHRPEQVAGDREGRAVRDVEDLGRAEDQREADRGQRVDRAELQAIEDRVERAALVTGDARATSEVVPASTMLFRRRCRRSP